MFTLVEVLIGILKNMLIQFSGFAGDSQLGLTITCNIFQAGITPSCCIRPSWSKISQCSTD